MHTVRLYEYQLGERWLVVGDRAWNVTEGGDNAGFKDILAASKVNVDALRHYPQSKDKPGNSTSWLVAELNRHQLIIKHNLCGPETKRYLGLSGI